MFNSVFEMFDANFTSEKKAKTFNLMRIKDIKDFKQNLTKNIVLNVSIKFALNC